MPLSDPNVLARPEVAIERLPAVLSAVDIARVLQISRPIAYGVLHACRPFTIGRLQRCFAEDFRAYLEGQRDRPAV
jgi:hypothetical protein